MTICVSLQVGWLQRSLLVASLITRNSFRDHAWCRCIAYHPKLIPRLKFAEEPLHRSLLQLHRLSPKLIPRQQVRLFDDETGKSCIAYRSLHRLSPETCSASLYFQHVSHSLEMCCAFFRAQRFLVAFLLRSGYAHSAGAGSPALPVLPLVFRLIRFPGPRVIVRRRRVFTAVFSPPRPET